MVTEKERVKDLQAHSVWIDEGINSCIKNGYDLDRLTVNWQARDLRYTDADRTGIDSQIVSRSVLSTKSQSWTPLPDFGDIKAYEKDMPTGCFDNLRMAIREESDRFLSVAKEINQFIPSEEWSSFGHRTKKQSGESIVFYDELHGRVIKAKDPFAYTSLKNDNPYAVLYEHVVHNQYFGDVAYRFLGMSEDPVSGSVRFVFEQPFVDTLERPTKQEIHEWFTARGFHLTDAGFFYSNGIISFTDVWADNCLKDGEGRLRFIDPIIRFENRSGNIKDYYG